MTERFRPVAPLAIILTLAVLVLTATPAHALLIEGVLTGALDQPRINAILRVDATVLDAPGLFIDESGNLIEGSVYNIEGFLDTGAGTLLLGPNTADSYGLPLQPTAVFTDAGVAGTDDFAVSENFTLQLAPFAGVLNETIADPTNFQSDADFNSVYTHTFTSQRAAVGPESADKFEDDIDRLIAQLQEFNVFGMPAMENKVVVMEASNFNKYLLTQTDPQPQGVPHIQTYLYDPGTPWNPGEIDTNPGIPPLTITDYTIPLTYADFDDYTITTGGDPPSLAHNPFIGTPPAGTAEPGSNTPLSGVTITGNGGQSTGSWLFDTGAAATIISTEQAGNLGVRYAPDFGPGETDTPMLERYDEASDTWVPVDQFELTIGGVGGTIVIAGFNLDTVAFDALRHTPAGDVVETITYTDVPVLVLDISIADPNSPDPNNPDLLTLDAIFGMNLLFPTIELDEPITLESLLAAPQALGAYNWVVFDEPNGELRLSVIPEPTSAMALLIVGGLLAGARRRR